MKETSHGPASLRRAPSFSPVPRLTKNILTHSLGWKIRFPTLLLISPSRGRGTALRFLPVIQKWLSVTQISVDWIESIGIFPLVLMNCPLNCLYAAMQRRRATTRHCIGQAVHKHVHLLYGSMAAYYGESGSRLHGVLSPAARLEASWEDSSIICESKWWTPLSIKLAVWVKTGLGLLLTDWA